MGIETQQDAVRRPSYAASLGSSGAEQLRRRYFRSEDHPYNILEREVARRLRPGDTLLDAGCGRAAPSCCVLFRGANWLIGVDLVDFSADANDAGLELLRGDLNRIQVESGSVDGIVSRSVMEHLRTPGHLPGVFGDSSGRVVGSSF